MTAPLSSIHTISKLFGSLKAGIRDLLFPSFCFECEKLLGPDELLFCVCCISQIEFQDPFSRCPVCFVLEGDAPLHLEKCPLINSPLKKLTTVFEGTGPVLSLTTNLTKERLYLAKGIAAYMAAFLLELNDPIPELVLPLPIPWTKKREKGFNPHEVIALEFAKMTGSLYANPLVSRINHAKDANGEAVLWFFPDLKDHGEVQDKNVLLIAMSSRNMEEIIDAASAVQQGCPKSISALTFIA